MQSTLQQLTEVKQINQKFFVASIGLLTQFKLFSRLGKQVPPLHQLVSHFSTGINYFTFAVVEAHNVSNDK